jgi:DNA-binding PadR family transcriptional regulator
MARNSQPAEAPATDSASFLPLQSRDFLILFVLSDGPLHGYGILKALEEAPGGAVHFDPANLYRSLRRLERDGLVAEVDPGQDDDVEDRRRSFTLTTLGSEVLAAEARRLSRLAEAARTRELVSDPGESR